MEFLYKNALKVRINMIRSSNSIMKFSECLEKCLLQSRVMFKYLPHCCVYQQFIQRNSQRIFLTRHVSNYQTNDNYSYGDMPRYRKGVSNDFISGLRLRKPDWQHISLHPIEKNFYIPSESSSDKMEDIKNFRKSNNMTIKGENIPPPILHFSDYPFPSDVVEFLSEKGFNSPYPIQSQGWPLALSGRDFVGVGQTGSGKTLGFIIPALIHIRHQPIVKRGEGPIAVVLAPTRELTQQILEVTNDVMRDIRTACVFGGAKRSYQIQKLEKGPSIIVATPGRLLDFLEAGISNLQRCSYLVLDEADRMLDMGFEPQIRKIIDQTRPDRQTLMWSATWPKDVRSLAADFMTEYIQLNIGSTELKANPNILQEFEFCESSERRERFLQMMKGKAEEASKILIFAETKRSVDFVVAALHRNGINARGIHGDHTQTSRDKALNGFRDGYFKVLVATNVASRGLDVDDISVVVNYDFPNCVEDYVHRIGRTARGEKQGKSFSYLTEENVGIAKDLIQVLKESGQEVPEDVFKLREMQDTTFRTRRRTIGRYNRFDYRTR